MTNVMGGTGFTSTMNTKVMDLCIGIDAGGSTVGLGAVDPTTCALLSPPIFIEPHANEGGTFEEDFKAFMGAIQVLIGQHAAPGAKVSIGFGVAGKVSDDRSFMYSCPNLGKQWANVPFVARTSQELGYEAFLYNDGEAGGAGVALLDESVKDEERFNFGIWGTGLGFCRIFRLPGGFLLFDPTESGHHRYRWFAFRMCGCGRRGCAEAYFSGGNIEKRYGLTSAKYLPKWRWWLRIFPGMALWMSNMASSFPGKTVFSGSVAHGQPRIIRAIDSVVRFAVQVLEPGAVTVTTAGPHAGIVGAAMLPRVMVNISDLEPAKPTDKRTGIGSN